MYILIAILILGLIIFVHELGHFTMAKIFGMPVAEFAIGMGPTVFSYTTTKTTYAIRAIPIGGYVNIEGMELDSKIPNGFNSKPLYQRFLVLIAGVLMNFILAYVVLFGSLYINGIKEVANIPVVNQIFPQAKAYEYLKPNDKILEINGIKIENWEDIADTLKKLNKKEVDITLLRDNKTQNIDVPLTKMSDKYMLGITPKLVDKKLNFIEASKLTIKTANEIFIGTFTSLKLVSTGKVKTKQLTGPIGIIKLVGDATQTRDVNMVIWLIALLSINIGVLNLLPLPALDGGRILFVLLEMFGIKVNKKFEERVHMVGMILLIGFIIYVSGNDIMRLIR